MGWTTTRTGRKYFYRSVRESGGNVRRKYFGTGVQAKLESKKMEAERRAEAAEQKLVNDAQLAISEAEQMTNSSIELTALIVEATLLAAGYWRGNDYRKWRRKRVKGK